MSDEVKIRYTWPIRLKMLAGRIVYYGSPILRPMLRTYDRIEDALTPRWSAEGYDDLTFREWWHIRWCELHARHVGHRISITHGIGMHHCDFCQCDWKKFDNHPRFIARRRALKAKGRYPATR